MLGYAVETRAARRKASSTTLALIVAGHAALILAVVNSKMELPRPIPEPPIVIETIEPPKDPPPVPLEPPSPQTNLRIPTPPINLDPPVIIPIPLPEPPLDHGMPKTPIGPGIGTTPIEPPRPVVRHGPKLTTPENVLRPPYPEAKRRLEEEAVLRLRLAIDERGRVRSVEPVGAADPLFLASTRKHLIRHWRYTPASKGGRAVASSIVINLRFELDDI